jgi:hypothetical protein
MGSFIMSAAIVNLVDIFAQFGQLPGRISIEASLSVRERAICPEKGCKRRGRLRVTERGL